MHLGQILEKYPDIHIIHFDAHADLREEYLGEQLSHASVIRRCWDLVGDGRIYQFGIRSGDREEFYWAKEHVTMRKFDFEDLRKCWRNWKERRLFHYWIWMCWIHLSFRERDTGAGRSYLDALRKAAEKV